jgi:asparagine synthase (glutamine-hydrolysing)
VLKGISGAADFSDVGASDSSLPDSSWIGQAARSLHCEPGLTGAGYTLGSTPGGDFCFVSAESGLAITADAELHNRAELLNKLSSRQLPSSCSDARLILAAYERWGENCPEFLLGEFSFAVWDARRARLFCSRDHLGRRTFFYWTNGVRFAFSTDPLCLFPLHGIGRRLNRAKFAAWAEPDGFDEGHEETFHAGILSLPAATSLTFERGRISKRGYWIPEVFPALVPKRDQEAFEALRELLFEAVACRLRGKRVPAAFLSGGLDSSSLVAIAAQCLQKENRSVLALAAVLPDSSKPEFQDEREFIEEFRTRPNVTIEYVSPEAGGPFDRIEDFSCFASVPLRYSREYLNDAMQKVAARAGADVILAGNGGEAGASTFGRGYYLELAASLRWNTLARELRRLRATRNISPVRMLGWETLDFLSPHRRFQPMMLLAPDFLLAMEDVRGTRKLHWPDHRREQANAIRSRMASHALRQGVPVTLPPVAFPFLDKRVLEFCLAMPGHMKVRDGYQRYPIRRALEGILPIKIQWRTSKCPFAPDYAKRYEAQLGKARDFVAAIGRKDPVRSIIDVDRLRYLLDQPQTPASREAALFVVPSTIYVICFLRQFAEFQP